MKGKPAAAFLAFACWAILVSLAYIKGHESNLGFALAALKDWSREPVGWESLVAVLPGHARGLGVAALCAFICWLASAPPARWFGVNGRPLRLALGLGTGSLLLLGAGLTGLFYPVLFLVAGGAAAVWGRVGTRDGGVRRCTPRFEAVIPAWMALGSLLLAAGSAALNLLGALAPEVGYDSLIQHLADPAQYLRAHRIYFNDLSCLAQHPAGLQMVYGWLLALGGDTAAMVFHWSLGLLAAWACWAWLARYWHRRDAFVFAAALYLTPFIGILSSRAYVDLGLVFYSACVLLAPWGSWLQGTLLGLGIGVKYSGGILLAGWLLALGLGRGGSAAAGRVAIAAALAAFCWGARNWINTGNPVYPFLFSLFGGLGWDRISAAQYLGEVSSYGRVFGISGHLAIPWLTFVRDRGALDSGSLGPLVLILAPLPLLVRPMRELGRFAMLATALWALYCLSPRQVRYALPFMPPTVALLALTVRHAWRRWTWTVRPGMVLLGGVLAVQAGVSLSALYLWSNPFPVAMGTLGRGRFLDGIISPHDPDTGLSLYMKAAERLAETMPPGASCLMIGDGKVYYLPGRWQVNALFNPRILKRLVVSSADPDRIAERLKQRGVTHLLYNVGGSIHIEYTHHLYSWTDREERALEIFVRRWLKPVWTLRTARRDPMYIFFELKRGNHPFPPYLPGVDTLIAGIEERAAKGDAALARAKARELLLRYPSSEFLPARVAGILAERWK